MFSEAIRVLRMVWRVCHRPPLALLSSTTKLLNIYTSEMDQDWDSKFGSDLLDDMRSECFRDNLYLNFIKYGRG